jgi:hypothetical protein
LLAPATSSTSTVPSTKPTVISPTPIAASTLATDPSPLYGDDRLFAELQQSSPFSPTKCTCGNKDAPTDACRCLPGATGCPCGGHEKNVHECSVPPDKTTCTCEVSDGDGRKCTCEPGCAGCDHGKEGKRHEGSSPVVLNL